MTITNSDDFWSKEENRREKPIRILSLDLPSPTPSLSWDDANTTVFESAQMSLITSALTFGDSLASMLT